MSYEKELSENRQLGKVNLKKSLKAGKTQDEVGFQEYIVSLLEMKLLKSEAVLGIAK